MYKKQIIFVISRELFQSTLILYLVLAITETLLPGRVSDFFNINYLLIITLISGIVAGILMPQIPTHDRAPHAVAHAASSLAQQAARRYQQSRPAVLLSSQSLQQRRKLASRRKSIDGIIKR